MNPPPIAPTSIPSSRAFTLERPLLRLTGREAKLARGRTDTSLPFFVYGDENRLPAFLCQSELSSALGQLILLTGPAGCGKSTLATHLAARFAIASDRGGDATAIQFVSGADFARQYAEAVDSDDLPPLRESIDDAAILVIDDLHLMTGKMAAQDELSVRLESRIAAGKPTVLTCRRLPADTRGMRSQLASRCVAGLTIPINLPSSESRQTILRELALLRGLELSDQLIGLLDAGLRTELAVPVLDAAIKQVQLYCRMNDSSADVLAIQSAIHALTVGDEVDLGKITRIVAKVWGHRSKDLRSNSRKQSVVRARSLAMLLARQMTSHSLDKIGQYFGGRDHSTVLHAIRKTQSLLEEDGDLSRMMNEASEKLAA